jgi:hypothetical protein
MQKLLPNIPGVAPTEAISHAANLLLPTPSESNPGDANVGNTIIAEIRNRLRLKKDDLSPKALGRIYDALVTEMFAHNLTPEQEKQAAIRLGQRGDLRPNLYRIEMPDAFLNRAKIFGVRRSHVEEVLRYPDVVDHIQKEAARVAVSLYVKKVSLPKGNGFTWVVVTQRDGINQTVNSALRLYDQDFPDVDDTRPIDMLRAFLEVFGVSFRLGGGSETKLVLNEMVPDPPGLQISAQIPPGSPEKFMSLSIVRKMNNGYLDIALAYVLNITRYVAALNRHGVGASV